MVIYEQKWFMFKIGLFVQDSFLCICKYLKIENYAVPKLLIKGQSSRTILF